MINISPSNIAELVVTGLSPSIFVDRRGVTDPLPYIIIRSDARITSDTRLAIRYNRFDGDRRNSGLGELNTTERSFDLRSWDHALAGQLVTELSPTILNEFRLQYAKRFSTREANEDSGQGPSVSISGRANLGRNPIVGGDETNNATTQFYDAFTKVLDSHLVKAGGGVNFIRNSPRQAVFSLYEFPSILAYQDALRSDGNRRGYSSYQEAFGDPDVNYGATFLNLFAQDEWNATRRLKFNFGLRYDLYSPPSGDPSAPLAFSQNFRTDYNNFSPRLGAAYLIRAGSRPTVLRVGTGIYYDPPFLFPYRKAILNNGNSRFVSLSFSPSSNGAPEFPLRPTTGKRDIDAISPDFNTMYAVHSNIRLEQALTQDMSLTVGYIHTFARQMPVTRNINCRPTGATLADGRPLYGTAEVMSTGAVVFLGCSNPIDANYRRILLVESAGNLQYDGLIFQLTRRFSSGYQFGANYTSSLARDDAPEDIAPGTLNALSDPSSRETDRANSTGDVRHFLSFSMVARPRIRTGHRFLDLLAKNNQLSFLAIADSGSNFNFTTGDINRDGVSGDRPVGVARNFGSLPATLNLDARYSRFFELKNDSRLEIFVEGSNVLNSKQIASYNGTNLAANHLTNSPVNPLTGELRSPLPKLGGDFANWRPSRQLQVGVKILF